MARYRLMLEDHADVFPASLEAVQKAVSKLAIPEGPTFLNLTDENGNWAQAGGTEGRYRVEARHVYGEGFQHVMASRLDCRMQDPTVEARRHPERVNDFETPA